MLQNQCVALHPICRVHRLLRHLSQWWFWAVTWMENWIRKSVHQELLCCNHFCLKIKCGSSNEAFISEIRPIIKYLVFLSSGFVCSLQSRFGSFQLWYCITLLVTKTLSPYWESNKLLMQDAEYHYPLLSVWLQITDFIQENLFLWCSRTFQSLHNEMCSL
jgi:hypothetical protein